MSTKLPTPREALSHAVMLLRAGDHDLADTWIYLAKELREGGTPPTDALTLHDVEGIVCAHGRVAVRSRTSPLVTWFRHADGDPSVCDDAQPETDHQRRAGTGEALVQSYAEGPQTADSNLQTTPSDLDQTAVLMTRARVSPASSSVPPSSYGLCMHCNMPVYMLDREQGMPVKYAHTADGQQVCKEQRTREGDETFVHTFAWPRSQG